MKYDIPPGKGFLSALLDSSPPIIREAFPLHDSEEKNDLVRMLKLSLIPMRGIDVDKIRNYFGKMWLVTSLCLIICIIKVKGSGGNCLHTPTLPMS